MGNANIETLKPLKTWSHLADRKRKPSEYEIVSTNLHYTTDRPEQPFELDSNVPIANWYKKYRTGSPVVVDDWNAFRDPDEIIYRIYNITQDGQESFVFRLFDQMSERGHDEVLAHNWVNTLGRFYTPLRYFVHGLQMMSGYLVQIAPASTISNAAAYQAGDHLRWLNHIAYRTRELALNHPEVGFGEHEKDYWENDPAWTDLREVLERGLVAWDWVESFVVMNLVLKPILEDGIMASLRAVGRSNDDTLLALLIDSELIDAQRHRRWASALIRLMVEGRESNRISLQTWMDKWNGPALSALQRNLQLMGAGECFDEAKRRVMAFQRSALETA